MSFPLFIAASGTAHRIVCAGGRSEAGKSSYFVRAGGHRRRCYRSQHRGLALPREGSSALRSRLQRDLGDFRPALAIGGAQLADPHQHIRCLGRVADFDAVVSRL